MRTRPERYDAPLVWLRANKHDLAPLTGQDTAVLLAIAYCWRVWGHSDARGRLGAIESVRALLRGMQPTTVHLAREVIPWALDWSHREELWPMVWEGGA